jgi:hypothetical protein
MESGMKWFYVMRGSDGFVRFPLFFIRNGML